MRVCRLSLSWSIVVVIVAATTMMGCGARTGALDAEPSAGADRCSNGNLVCDTPTSAPPNESTPPTQTTPPQQEHTCDRLTITSAPRVLLRGDSGGSGGADIYTPRVVARGAASGSSSTNVIFDVIGVESGATRIVATSVTVDASGEILGQSPKTPIATESFTWAEAATNSATLGAGSELAICYGRSNGSIMSAVFEPFTTTKPGSYQSLGSRPLSPLTSIPSSNCLGAAWHEDRYLVSFRQQVVPKDPPPLPPTQSITRLVEVDHLGTPIATQRASGVGADLDIGVGSFGHGLAWASKADDAFRVIVGVLPSKTTTERRLELLASGKRSASIPSLGRVPWNDGYVAITWRDDNNKTGMPTMHLAVVDEAGKEVLHKSIAHTDSDTPGTPVLSTIENRLVRAIPFYGDFNPNEGAVKVQLISEAGDVSPDNNNDPPLLSFSVPTTTPGPTPVSVSLASTPASSSSSAPSLLFVTWSSLEGNRRAAYGAVLRCQGSH